MSDFGPNAKYGAGLKGLLIGVHRKWLATGQNDAIDPEQTSHGGESILGHM